MNDICRAINRRISACKNGVFQCRAINRRISACKNGVFQFNYSVEQGKIYISSPFDSEKVILDENMGDVLGFKQNIINVRTDGALMAWIFSFSLTIYLVSSWINLYLLTVQSLKHREFVIALFPSYVFLNEKPVKIILLITISSIFIIFLKNFLFEILSVIFKN